MEFWFRHNAGVYGYDARKQKIPSPLLIAIDIGDVTFA